MAILKGNPKFALSKDEEFTAREAIRFLRENRFTHVMLAKELGITTSNTNNWYNYGRSPSKKLLPKIMEIYERQKNKLTGIPL